MSMTESGSILAVPLFTVPSSRQQRQCFWCTNCKHQSVKLKEPKLTSNLNKFNLLVLGLGVHWIGFLFQLSCGLEVLVAKLRFRDDLEESGDFGVFWSLLSAKLHRYVRCLAMAGDLPTVRLRYARFTEEWSVCLARGSCRGDEGLSIDGASLPSVNGDAKIWAEHIL
ncbi:hypothetical protein F2Q68_00035473 [Brassica cretica]|uniref:Uncharacterized protein n=1 Tax=Brassica cretica TaxID=69181 RepID=A0A8S9H4V0_BRACR|nr:hypothetical protein F2Q68_00035473 [Brassica cretica]